MLILCEMSEKLTAKNHMFEIQVQGHVGESSLILAVAILKRPGTLVSQMKRFNYPLCFYVLIPEIPV